MTGLLPGLDEIAEIGRDPRRGGYSRHLWQHADRELRDWLTERAVRLGLSVEIDRNGNTWAWWGPRGDDAVVVGSHLDSVPGGGAYDGPLGVVSALDAIARLKARAFRPSRPCALLVFAEEEGSRFGIACLGSRLMTGALDPVRARTKPERKHRNPLVRKSVHVFADYYGSTPQRDSCGQQQLAAIEIRRWIDEL